MQKKFILISFIVVVLIWVGIMVSKHLGQAKEQKVANEAAYTELIRVAKNSPTTGLADVALRLNKYREKKGTYPERLIELYPDYLPSEAYIREIQWEYKKSGDNFTLKKTITLEGRQRTTVVSKDLNVQSVTTTAVAQNEEDEGFDDTSEEQLGVMVASPGPVPVAEDKTSPEISDSGETEKPAETDEMSDEMLALEPKIVSVVKEDIGPGIDPKLGSVYLVWKDENGRLGFGNVDYPSSQRLSVYSDGMYQTMRQSAPLEQKLNPVELKSRKKSKDEIALTASKQALVWRNKDGTLGFGNIDYPKGDNVSQINVNGTWEEIKKPQP